MYKDDPANSVRSKVPNDTFLQRKHVLNDFIAWCDTQKDLKPYYAIEARKYLLRNSFLSIIKTYIFLARTIRQKVLDLRSNFFYNRTKILNPKHINIFLGDVKYPDRLEIVTIAFNNNDVIRDQVKLIKKNLLDDR